YNRRLYDIVAAHGADMIVAHSFDFVSPALGEKTGLAVVRVHLQPSILRTVHRVPVLSGTVDYSFLPRRVKRLIWRIVDRALLDPPIAPVVNELRGRVGLAPVKRIFATQLHSTCLTLALFPEWYAPRQPDWPVTLEQCDFPL